MRCPPRAVPGEGPAFLGEAQPRPCSRALRRAAGGEPRPTPTIPDPGRPVTSDSPAYREAAPEKQPNIMRGQGLPRPDHPGGLGRTPLPRLQTQLQPDSRPTRPAIGQVTLGGPPHAGGFDTCHDQLKRHSSQAGDAASVYKTAGDHRAPVFWGQPALQGAAQAAGNAPSDSKLLGRRVCAPQGPLFPRPCPPVSSPHQYGHQEAWNPQPLRRSKGPRGAPRTGRA